MASSARVVMSVCIILIVSMVRSAVEVVCLILSYQGVLERGYAVVRDARDNPLQGISAVKTGSNLSIEMTDGRLQVVAGKNPGATKGERHKKTGKSACCVGGR